MKVKQAIDIGLKVATCMVLVPVSATCSVIGGLTMIVGAGTAQIAKSISDNLSNTYCKETESE